MNWYLLFFDPDEKVRADRLGYCRTRKEATAKAKDFCDTEGIDLIDVLTPHEFLTLREDIEQIVRGRVMGKNWGGKRT